jgi:WD40 repeat protein
VLTGQAPGNAPAKQNKRRKRRKPILAAALATLLLALVLGYYLKSPARKAPQGPVESAASDDKTIRLWDTASGKLLKTATEHQSLVNAFAMSPDKQFLVSVSEDSKIKLWRLPELVFVKDLGTTASGGAAVAFLSNDSEHLAVSDWKGAIQRIPRDATRLVFAATVSIGEGGGLYGMSRQGRMVGRSSVR